MRFLRISSCSIIGVILVVGLAGCQVLFEPTEPPATWMPLPTVGSTDTPPPPTSVPSATPIPTEVVLTPTPVPTRLARLEDPAAGASWGRDQAWAYLLAHNPDPRQPPSPAWHGPSIQGMIGATKYSFSAGFWSATIAVPLVAPDKIVYDVHFAGPGGYAWQAQVYPDGHIAADSPTLGSVPEPVEGVQGTLHLDTSSPDEVDFFRSLSDAEFEVGVDSFDETAQGHLLELRDSGEAISIWGVLIRDVDDYGGAQILVSRVAAQETPTAVPGETPSATPVPDDVATDPTSFPTPRPTTPQRTTEIVEGWVGVVRSTPGVKGDRVHFDGQQPARQYGIRGAIAPLEEQLADYAASGALVRIYGMLELGVDDYGQGRIVVSHIEPL